MWSDVTLIKFFCSVCWFCSISCAFFSSGSDGSRVNKVGCMVVVLVLASAFLHVKVSD